MKKHVTRLIAPLCLIALQQPLLAQDAVTSDELVAIDLRPQDEKEGTGLTALSGKCNQGVFRIADVATDPLKVEVLRADLSRQLGLAGDGKTLTVLNWSAYYNKSAERGGGPKISSIGVQGYAIPSKTKEKQMGSKCSRKESAGGWYQASDVSSQYSPIISEFEGTYGGKPFTVRVVHSPRRQIDGKFVGGANDTEALLEAVHKTAEALVTAIVQ
jgi:hypothetical protein